MLGRRGTPAQGRSRWAPRVRREMTMSAAATAVGWGEQNASAGNAARPCLRPAVSYPLRLPSSKAGR